MPCNSDYMERSTIERELQRTSILLRWSLQQLGKPVPQWVQDSAEDYYGNSNDQQNRIVSRDAQVVELCSLLRSLNDSQLDNLIYQNLRHDRVARDLADWWEDHQEVDRQRELQEAQKAELTNMQKLALQKLTPEERKVLGF